MESTEVHKSPHPLPVPCHLLGPFSLGPTAPAQPLGQLVYPSRFGPQYSRASPVHEVMHTPHSAARTCLQVRSARSCSRGGGDAP